MSMNPNAPGGSYFTRNTQEGARQAYMGPMGQLGVPSHLTEYNTQPPPAETPNAEGISMPKLQPRERSISLSGAVGFKPVPPTDQSSWPGRGTHPWHSSPASPRPSMHQHVPKLNIASDDPHAKLEFDDDEDVQEKYRRLRAGDAAEAKWKVTRPASFIEPYTVMPGIIYRHDSRVTIHFTKLQSLDYQACRDMHFYHPGRVFIVSPLDKDIHLAGRTMIVLAMTDHGAALCLSLCNHPDVSGREGEKFFNSHTRVTVFGLPQPQDALRLQPGISQRPTIMIYLKAGLDLMGSVWVNCQHPWTVQGSVVAVADAGYMHHEDRMTLTKEYLDVQKRMLPVP